MKAQAASSVRELQPHDMPAYKALRDHALANHEDAFTSDAATEAHRTAQSYASRLGADERLYERAGFVRYGTLARAIRVGGRFLDKHHMLLQLK